MGHLVRMALMVSVAAVAACKPEGQAQQEQALKERYESAKKACEALQDDVRQACEDEAEQLHKQQMDALKRRGGMGGAGDPAGGAM